MQATKIIMLASWMGVPRSMSTTTPSEKPVVISTSIWLAPGCTAAVENVNALDSSLSSGQTT